MNIGFTGSRELTARQTRQANQIIEGFLSCYTPGVDIIHHGGAKGIDAIADKVAKRYGFEIVRHLPTRPAWHGKGGYKYRNMKLVEAIECLYAIHAPESQTGGTFFTFNYAFENGRECEWLELMRDNRGNR